jgi:hypothetical protein
LGVSVKERIPRRPGSVGAGVGSGVLDADVAMAAVANGCGVSVGVGVDSGAASSVSAGSGCGVSVGAAVARAVGSSVTAGMIPVADAAGDGVAAGVGSAPRIPTSIPRQAIFSASTAAITHHLIIRSSKIHAYARISIRIMPPFDVCVIHPKVDIRME